MKNILNLIDTIKTGIIIPVEISIHSSSRGCIMINVLCYVKTRHKHQRESFSWGQTFTPSIIRDTPIEILTDRFVKLINSKINSEIRNKKKVPY